MYKKDNVTSQTLAVRGFTRFLLSLQSDYNPSKTALILFNRNITKEKHDNNHKKTHKKSMFLCVYNNFYNVISKKKKEKINYDQ